MNINLLLCLAVEAGRAHAVRYLLQRGSPHATDDDMGWTLLCLGCFQGHISTVRELVKFRADVNQLNRDGSSPALCAAKHVVGFELTAFELAALKSTERHVRALPSTLRKMGTCLELLALLVRKGANMDLVNCEGTSPLMVASEGGSTQVVELLLNSKASVNLADKRGFTAAHYASINGHCNALVTLLERGADINREGVLGGRTPLMMAFEGKQEAVAKILLMNGARVGSGRGTFGFQEVLREEWKMDGSSFFDRLLKWMETHRSPFSSRCIIDNCDFYGNPGAGGLCSEHATVGSYTREEK